MPSWPGPAFPRERGGWPTKFPPPKVEGTQTGNRGGVCPAQPSSEPTSRLFLRPRTPSLPLVPHPMGLYKGSIGWVSFSPPSCPFGPRGLDTPSGFLKKALETPLQGLPELTVKPCIFKIVAYFFDCGGPSPPCFGLREDVSEGK